MPNDEGITPLHNAVCAGHHHIVKFLLDFGVNVNAADSDGWSVASTTRQSRPPKGGEVDGCGWEWGCGGGQSRSVAVVLRDEGDNCIYFPKTLTQQD